MMLRRFYFSMPVCSILLQAIFYLIAFDRFATPQLCGQNSPQAERRRDPAYVRRFSAGGRFSVLPLNPIDTGELSTQLSDRVFFDAASTSNSSRVGGGITTQFAVSNKLAVGLEFLFHGIDYEATTETTTDILDPFTGELKDSQLVSTVENTSASILEVPLLIRYYTRGRRERGPRTFFEAGVSMRKVRNIRTSIETRIARLTDTEQTVECCDETPAKPAHRASAGAVIGVGVQVIDDVGIRVIPGVRYTRWFSNAFDAPPTRSGRNQIEATIALTF